MLQVSHKTVNRRKTVMHLVLLAGALLKKKKKKKKKNKLQQKLKKKKCSIMIQDGSVKALCLTHSAAKACSRPLPQVDTMVLDQH